MSLAYHRLRAAQTRFSVAPLQLEPQQREQVEREATAAEALESRVLSSPEAASVVLSDEAVDEALATITGRYDDSEAMADDLAANGLDEATLREAIVRELRFDAVMQRVGSGDNEPDELALRSFFEANRDRFTIPERRRARHILITLNDEFADNRRDRAAERIEALASELGGSGERFAELATAHSECPTALEGGVLGEITPGTLYPELDAVLFDLAEDEISGVVESEVGFHLLWCEAITPGKAFSFDEVRERIRSHMIQRAERSRQRAWLQSLEAASPDPV